MYSKCWGCCNMSAEMENMEEKWTCYLAWCSHWRRHRLRASIKLLTSWCSWRLIWWEPGGHIATNADEEVKARLPPEFNWKGHEWQFLLLDVVKDQLEAASELLDRLKPEKPEEVTTIKGVQEKLAEGTCLMEITKQQKLSALQKCPSWAGRLLRHTSLMSWPLRTRTPSE